MKRFLILISLNSLLVGIYGQINWDNNFFQTLYKVCPDGTAVSRVTSTYTPQFGGDRRFEFRCSYIPGNWNQCSWQGFTVLGQDFSRVCPYGQVMKGVYADYQGGDRIWNIYCCGSAQFELRYCRSSRGMGQGRGFIFSSAPAYFSAIISFNDEATNDRRYHFGFCDLYLR